LPRLSKTEQIVAVTNAMLGLRVSAIVSQVAQAKVVHCDDGIRIKIFLTIFMNRPKEAHEIIDEMRTSRMQLRAG
jgi:RNA binding exosome subunit